MRPFYRAGDYGMKKSVGYLVRRSGNLILPQLEVLFADQDLNFSQWTVLMALRDSGASTAGELARDICHDAGSLTRIIDELERRALVTRQRSETDRRIVALTLTPRGAGMVETLVPRVVDFWNSLLGDFSHAEIKTLIRLLTRLVAAAGDSRDEFTIARRNKLAVRARPREGHSQQRRGRA